MEMGNIWKHSVVSSMIYLPCSKSVAELLKVCNVFNRTWKLRYTVFYMDAYAQTAFYSNLVGYTLPLAFEVMPPMPISLAWSVFQ